MAQLRTLFGLFCLISSFLLVGCRDAGVQAGSEWVAQQRAAFSSPVLPPVLALVDTDPAIYAGEIVRDPFARDRLRGGVGDRAMKDTGVIFPGSPLPSIMVMGYLVSDSNKPVAMMRVGTDYRAVHVGDRLGDSEAVVQQISAKGVQVVLDGGVSRWLLINRS